MVQAKRDITSESLIEMIVNALNLHHIDRSTLGDDTELVGGGLDLDSVDILELVVTMEKKYDIRIKSEEVGRSVFQNIGTLRAFLSEA
jgi:acyl carrier protein